MSLLRTAVNRALPLARASTSSPQAAPARRTLAGNSMPVGDTANAVAAEALGKPSSASAKIAGGLLVVTTAGLWGWETLRAPDSGMWTIRGKAA